MGAAAEYRRTHAQISALTAALPLLQSAAVTATVGASMAKANEAMAAIGKTNDPAKIAATLQQFSKETSKMDMGQEMMDDALDDAFDTEDAEDETDDIMNQARPCFWVLKMCAILMHAHGGLGLAMRPACCTSMQCKLRMS
jgi:hypothetical protein